VGGRLSRKNKVALRDVEFEPAREADVVKIEVGAGRFFFDDVYGFGAFGEGRKKEREGVALTTVFEVGLAGVEFDVDGLDMKFVFTPISWNDPREDFIMTSI
jgi:hypothetical protein